jgi:hypothetical protein
VPLALVEAQRGAASVPIETLVEAEFLGLSVRTSGVLVGDHVFVPAAPGLTPPPPTPDGKVFVYATTFYPGTSLESEASLIAVQAGDDRRGVDFQLRPIAASRVSGTVTGPSGPIANLSLTLKPAATNLLSSPFFEMANTRTDPAGGFVFLGVPPGQYSLTALSLPSRTSSSSSSSTTTVIQGAGGRTSFIGGGGPAAVAIPDGPTLWADVPVSVGTNDVTGLAVTLQTGFRVKGRVEFDGAAAKPAGTALRNLLVRFEPVEGRLGTVTATRGSLDLNGVLTTYELPAGRYLVEVNGNLPGWTFHGAMINGIDVSDVPFDLRDGTAEVVLSFVDRASSVGGLVRQPNGQPDADAQVLVFPADAAAADFQGSARRTRLARVGRAGDYRVTGLPAGDYLAIAVAADAAQDFPSIALLRSLARQASRIRVDDRADHALNLTTVRAR